MPKAFLRNNLQFTIKKCSLKKFLITIPEFIPSQTGAYCIRAATVKNNYQIIVFFC
jgi:hypothetical protein